MHSISSVTLCEQPDITVRKTSIQSYRMAHMAYPLVQALLKLHHDESGQGLVEYLLILALVAFAAVAGMSSLASGLNSAFAKVSSVLGTYIT